MHASALANDDVERESPLSSAANYSAFRSSTANLGSSHTLVRYVLSVVCKVFIDIDLLLYVMTIF